MKRHGGKLEGNQAARGAVYVRNVYKMRVIYIYILYTVHMIYMQKRKHLPCDFEDSGVPNSSSFGIGKYVVPGSLKRKMLLHEDGNIALKEHQLKTVTLR